MSAPTDEITSTAVIGTPRLITPAFLLAWLVNFSLYLTFYFLVTTMALYAISQFAASDTAGGFAASAFVAGATVARLFAGFIVDRLGRRRVMIIGLVVSTIASALYIPADSLGLLILIRIAHGIAYGFAGTAVMALVQTVIPPERRAEGTGYFALGSTLATALGPALSLLFLGSFSYAALFWVATTTSAVGLILALFLRTPSPSPEGEDNAEKTAFSLRDMVHPKVIPIGLFMMIVGLCYTGVITYLNAYSLAAGLVAGAGFFFLAYALSMFIMRFFLGRIQDQRGDDGVIYFGLFFLALALALLAIAQTDWQIILAGIFTGLGYGTLLPAAQAIAVSLVPPAKVGTGISTLHMLMDLGLALGPLFLGGIVTALGFGPMYAVLVGVVLLAALFYRFTHGRRTLIDAADHSGSLPEAGPSRNGVVTPS
ncbi:MFS transporter [Corynebacterium sp. A21]|uniref:MFS transporter n=1 Tax=Corynebacterium sp. A21 TaxID=3457318 RepID=UPI003FD5EFA9